MSLAVLAACGVEPLEPSGDPADLDDVLVAPRSFAIDGADSAVNALAVALRQDSENGIEFEIASGAVSLQAVDGALAVSRIEVALADVTIPATVLPPDGLTITDVVITLEGPASAEAEWTTDGRRADASIEVDLRVKWSMLRDGVQYPLADVRVQALPLHIAVTRDGDRVELDVSADRAGPFWSWAKTFELRDLSLSLSGVY